MRGATKDWAMKICIDADACPVTRSAERVAKEYEIPLALLCDPTTFCRPVTAKPMWLALELTRWIPR